MKFSLFSLTLLQMYISFLISTSKSHTYLSIYCTFSVRLDIVEVGLCKQKCVPHMVQGSSRPFLC
jgi:hypothetical protein